MSALKYNAKALQLLDPRAQVHTQGLFRQDNTSVRPSNIDNITRAIYTDLEQINSSLGAAVTFVSLLDTPNNYSAASNLLIGVNNGETDVEYKSWGISNQTLYPNLAGGSLGKSGNGVGKLYFDTTGNIDYQDDLTILSAGVQKAVFKATTGYLGIGVVSPLESLHTSGGIKIGNAVQSTAGTIRWSGTDFEGYTGSAWVSFIFGYNISSTNLLWTNSRTHDLNNHVNTLTNGTWTHDTNVITNLLGDVFIPNATNDNALTSVLVLDGSGKIKYRTSSSIATPTSLSTGTVTATTYGITSDGSVDDVVLVEANTTEAGLLSAAKWNEIVANTAKVSNVTTNLSISNITTTTLDVVSSDGTDATLPAATTLFCGLMTAAKFNEVEANNAKVTNATHSGHMTGATALTAQPALINDQPNLAAPVGTEKVLIEDAGALKHILISALAGGTALGNVLFVSTTGSNTETRANAIGNINKPLTHEQVKAVALPYDSVFVFPGDYTLTLTGTNGYAFEGGKWHYCYGATTNKATAGAQWSTVGFSIGCNVTGMGSFYGSGSCGRIYYDGMSATDYIFEGNYCENTAAACHETAAVNSGIHNIRFKTRIKSTASYAILPAGGTAYIDCPEIISTSVTNAVYLYQCQKVFINGNRIENTTGGIGLETSNVGKCVFNVSYINQAYLRSALSVSGNFYSDKVTFDGLTFGTFTNSGTIVEYVHVSGNAILPRVNKPVLSGKGKVTIGYSPQQQILINGSDSIEVNLTCENYDTDYQSSMVCTNPLADVKLNGLWRTTFKLDQTAGKIKLNGTIKPSSYRVTGGEKYVMQMTGGTFDLGESGCIDLTNISANEVKGIWKTGGTFISNGGRIILQNATQIPVGDSASVQNIKLYSGGVNTNDVDFLGARTGTLGLTNLITGTAPTYDADIIS